MAITIQSNPGAYYSVNGDLIWVVYEGVKANDPLNYPDYKYVADVYIGSDMVARIKKVPLPSNKMGVFNLSDIIRAYVSATFNPVAATLQAQQLALTQFFTNVTIKFGEEYNFVTYTNVTVDSQRTFYNHYNGDAVGVGSILPSYVNLVASTRPAITQLRSNNANNFIPYLPNSTSAVTVTIKAYDEGNNNTGTYIGSITPTAANVLQIVNASVTVSNSLSPGIIAGSTKYYTVKIGTASLYQFNLVCEPRFETYTLHFLNKFGGFETKEFTKVSRKVLAITKTDFGKLPYSVDVSGVVSYYNSNSVYNETAAVYASQYTQKLTLNSDSLSDEEYAWLSELILSPLIYIEQSGYFMPVAIISNNYEFKKHVNDKLTNLTIDVTFGNQLNAQYR